MPLKKNSRFLEFENRFELLREIKIFFLPAKTGKIYTPPFLRRGEVYEIRVLRVLRVLKIFRFVNSLEY